MRRLFVIFPLLVLLGVALWFAGRSWTYLAGESMPTYGWVAMGGGILMSLVVGCGLMALLFYSHRHGYDGITEQDRRNDGAP